MKKYNQKFLKVRNKGQILKLLIEDGPKSRAEISKKLGIVRSTVSESVNEMIKANIINEGKKITGNVGKRPILICFNKNYFYFIAVVISPYNIDITICNLLGEIIIENSTSYDEDFKAKDILNSTVKNINKLMDRLKIDISEICFMSLGSPETFSKKTGKIRWAPYIRDWVGVDLKGFFESKFNTKIIIKDHVKLETMGEQWKSFPNVKNMVYMVITRGIGAGIIIDGKVREGHGGYMGEASFLPVSSDIDFEEAKNQDKNLGYFESKCDIIRIMNIIKPYLDQKNLYYSLTDFSMVGKLYNTNPDIKSIIDTNIIRTLALGISTIIIILDPELLVINGEIVDLGDSFLDLLKSEVKNFIPYKRDIVFSSLRKKSGIYGAIKNGLDYIMENIQTNSNKFFKVNLQNDSYLES